jgi:hypothetical protein
MFLCKKKLNVEYYIAKIIRKNKNSYNNTFMIRFLSLFTLKVLHDEQGENIFLIWKCLLHVR